MRDRQNQEAGGALMGQPTNRRRGERVTIPLDAALTRVVPAIEPDEEWRPLPGRSGYEVSSLGNVRSYWRHGCRRALASEPKYKRLHRNRLGYLRVNLAGPGAPRAARLVHQLVLEAFAGPRPAGNVVRHLNGVRDDNRIVNLAWGTHQQNSDDMCRHGNQPSGDRSGIRRRPESFPHGSKKRLAKLCETDVARIKERLTNGESASSVAIDYAHVVNRSVIYRIRNGTGWMHCGRLDHPSRDGGRKLTDSTASTALWLYQYVGDQRLVARVVGVTGSNIHMLVRNKTWKHLPRMTP